MSGRAVGEVMLESGRLRISGEMGFASVLGLLAQTRELFSQGHGALEIDLAEVERVDSSGLALMIEWMRMARQQGRELQFIHLPEQLYAIARASDLDGILPVADAEKVV